MNSLDEIGVTADLYPPRFIETRLFFSLAEGSVSASRGQVEPEMVSEAEAGFHGSSPKGGHEDEQIQNV